MANRAIFEGDAMRRAGILTISAVVAALAGLPVAAAVVAPPAINMPAGGRIVTAVNLSDNDVLGIVKQSIPVVADVLKELAPAIAQHTGVSSGSGWAKLISLDEFSQAISGVKDVRMLIARYPESMTPERFLEEFSRGVRKSGPFSLVLGDMGFSPGSVGLYAAPQNAGMIGFAYDPECHTAYAVRVVGSVDVPKLIHWSGQVAKIFMEATSEVRPNGLTQPDAGVQPSQPATQSK